MDEPEVIIKGMVDVSKGGDYAYYRFKNGEIGYAIVNDFEEPKRFKWGWRPLEKYGSFPFNRPLPLGPWTHILARGGAGEFTPRQVVEMGWAYEPPVINGETVKFPQLKGYLVPEPHECCDRKLTPEQYRRHSLINHTKAVENLHLADQIGTALAEQQRGKSKYHCGECGFGTASLKKLGEHAATHEAEPAKETANV